MYRRLDLPDTIPAKPGSLPSGEPTQPGAAHGSLAGLDTIIGTGRRVLLEAGLAGSPGFLIPNGASTTSQSRNYPDEDSPRVVAKVKGAPLTPGHVVALELVALPSGPTQVDDGQGFFVEGERAGRVEILVTYRNLAGEFALRSEVIELEGSDEPAGGEPDSPWGMLTTHSRIVLSGPLLPNDEAWAKWTGVGVSVDLTLRYTGAPRVVDVVVVERPWVCTVDTVAPRRPAALYTDDDGAPLDVLSSAYPIIHTSPSDRALGTRSIVEAMAETGSTLGPVLWSWSAHREASNLALVIDYDGGAGDGGPVPWQVIGTEVEVLPVALGCLAQGVTQSAVLEASGALRVWVIVYWKTSGAPALLEVHSGGGWDVVELETDAVEWTWTAVPGWLEVGTDALAVGELRMRSSAPGHRAMLRYAMVCYAPS